MRLPFFPQTPAPRRLERFCWLVAIVLGFLQAWGRRHNSNDGLAYMGADGISYLDIGDAYWRGDWQAAINAMWSPFYSWLTGLTLRLIQPSPYWEFTVVQLLNFTIYLFALLAFAFFLRELKRFRDTRTNETTAHANSQTANSGDAQAANRSNAQTINTDDVQTRSHASSGSHALPDWAWLAFAYALFIWTSLSMNRVARTSPDVLVSALVFIASALLLRIRTRRAGWLTFALFGLTLGTGYLSKTFMFPLAFVFLAVSLFAYGNVRRAVPRVALALLVFLLVSLPFVAALSRAKHRLTIGDTARLNYAWHVNRTTPFIHWQGDAAGVGGGTSGTPAHPTRKLFASPAVYEFAAPVAGTYPPWYDPTYWHEGVQTRVSVRSQLKAIARNVLLAYQFMFYRFFPGALLACLFILFYMSRRSLRRVARDISAYWFLLLPALVASSFYMLVHFEQRYFAPFVVVIGMSLFASLRLPRTPEAKRLTGALVIVALAMFALSTGYYSARELYSTVRDLAPGRAAREDVQWQVADELSRMGIARGESVASIGNTMFNAWPRLARVRVVAEISTRTGGDVEKFWAADAALKRQVIETFARTGAKVVVAEGIPQWANNADGWQRIGTTNYYVYILSRS
jgi:4-amino-4-deoxy-L-arabinose transferase-like glycosyltransferase